MKVIYRNLFLPVLFLPVILFIVSCTGRTKVGTSDGESFYLEKFRPQYHFSPKTGWMNDPNGLVYHDNEYHLFYQHYPDSTVWGPMHWGHAVSTDLIHWTQLPIALYPDSHGYIFSGSAVPDLMNTSGMGNGVVPPLIAIFTYHDPMGEKNGSNTFQNQGMAYSNDNGRTWNKYPAGPVLLNPGIRDFRDPKVFWHEESGKWIVILAVHDRVHLYSSPDLKKWDFESEFGSNAGSHGGVWECPDLFPLDLDGSGSLKWVMLVSINPGGPNSGSATQYFTGNFDGHNFTPDDTSVKWMDQGTDNYAGVTFSGIQSDDGRRILIGWMSNWNYANTVPASVWRSAMTIPRVLSLYSEEGGSFLASSPVEETSLLRTDSLDLLRMAGREGSERSLVTGDPGLNRCELNLIFGTSKDDTIGIVIGNEYKEKLLIAYSDRDKEIFIDRSAAGDTSFSMRYTKILRAPYSAGKTIAFHVFLDETSAELFVDDGKMVMTTIFFPSSDYSHLSVMSADKKLLQKAELFHLKSIWKQK